MSTASGPADWSSRPVVSALDADTLAELLDRARSRSDAVLFTVTPAGELDEVARWDRLGDLAFAGKCRAVVAMFERARPQEQEFVADEVGLAIGASSTTGGNLLDVALAAVELGLLDAVETGLLTERHVRSVVRELERVELTVEQRQAVVLLALARFSGEAPGELGKLVARLILQIDLAAAAARERVATGRRRIWFSGDVDGQSVMVTKGPTAAIAAVRAALEATLPLHPEPGDERSREAREFDLLVDLLTGGQVPGAWSAQIVVPFTTAAGQDLELAEIPGLGPVLPSTARELLERCDTISQIAVDEDGQVIAVGDPIRRPAEQAQERRERQEPADRWLTDAIARTAVPPAPRELAGSGYRFPPRLERFLKTRDRTCVFPGCNRRAVDLDHRIPWPYGKTDADNGQCLCRHHHRAKHTSFTVVRNPDGSYTWTTRSGWRFHRPPKGF